MDRGAASSIADYFSGYAARTGDPFFDRRSTKTDRV